MSDGENFEFLNNWEFYINLAKVLVTGILGLVVWVSTKRFNSRQSKLATDRLQKELFSEFNKRYDELNDYLLEITDTECTDMSILKLIKPDRYDLLRYKLNDYFNLCAEEYYWYKKGRVDEDLWKSWEVGMNSWYNNHAIIKEAWKEEYKKFGCQSFYLKKNEQFFKQKF